MGILNATPDSFSDGGLYSNCDDAVRRALEMEEDGADIIDVGGESTRPGAASQSAEEELGRVIPVIEGLRKRSSIPVTIDTTKARVAAEALDAGADGINDISGFTFDPDMTGLAAKRDCPVVVMHIKGTPRTMQREPVYDDVVEDIRTFLKERAAALMNAGLDRGRIIIDPGIGFGKTVEHNLILIARLGRFKDLGFPVLVGASRKSFIGKLLDLPTGERLEGSLASAAISAWNGADILRVHDVKQTYRTLQIVGSFKKHAGG
ncbi:dihydropteroate synthase [Acidobacteriota bacterium]